MKICRIYFYCLIVASLLLCACRSISPRVSKECGRHLYRELDEYYRWNYGYPKDNSEFYSWLEDKQFAFDICTGKDSVTASRHLSDIKQKSTEKARVPLSDKQDVSDYERLLLFLSKYEIELVGDSNRLLLSSDRYQYRETREYHVEDDFANPEFRPRYPILGISDEGERIYIADEARKSFYRQIEQAVGEVPAGQPTTYTIIRYSKGTGMQDFLRNRLFQDSASKRVSRFLHDFCTQRNLRQITFPICLWPDIGL